MNKLIACLMIAAALTGCSSTKHSAVRWPVDRPIDPVTERTPNVLKP